jgi:hypothetical protein
MTGLKLRRQSVIELALAWRDGKPLRPARRALTPRPVEDLLAWAYREELPKMAADPSAPLAFADVGNPWDAVERFMDDLGNVRENAYGVAPDYQAFAEPHPDAVRVHEAVCRLDDLELGIPDDWSPLGDFGDLAGHAAGLPAQAIDRLMTRDRDGRARLRRTPRRLVQKHAILGGCPDFEIERPAIRTVTEHGKVKWFVRHTVMVEGAFGPVAQEVEIDGYDARRKRPRHGAYNKTFLDPDPLPGVIARAEYEVWRAALDVIAAELDGTLEEFACIVSDRPARPWEQAYAPASRRVLDDLAAPQAARERVRKASARA